MTARCVSSDCDTTPGLLTSFGMSRSSRGVDLLAIPTSLRLISETDAALLAAFKLLCMAFSS
jgi:hypothetical protein